MGAQTRKSVNAPRARTPSAKVRANTRKISKSVPKRVKSKVFINPDTISKESTPVLSEPSPPPLNRLKMFRTSNTTLLCPACSVLPLFSQTQRKTNSVNLAFAILVST